MKNFMRQFEGLSPMQKVQFEAIVFNLAGRMVKGYGGGQWESVKVGEVWALRIPSESDKSPMTLVNEEAGVSIETDATTASVAFSLLLVNWVWNAWAHANRLTHAAHLDFERVYHGLRNGAYADAERLGLNTDDFFTFTD